MARTTPTTTARKTRQRAARTTAPAPSTNAPRVLMPQTYLHQVQFHPTVCAVLQIDQPTDTDNEILSLRCPLSKAEAMHLIVALQDCLSTLATVQPVSRFEVHG